MFNILEPDKSSSSKILLKRSNLDSIELSFFELPASATHIWRHPDLWTHIYTNDSYNLRWNRYLDSNKQGGPISRGCPQHSPVNLPRTQVYPPCLEPETWLVKNRGGAIQNFTIAKNSLKKKHQCGKVIRQTWAILPDATGSSSKSSKMSSIGTLNAFSTISLVSA